MSETGLSPARVRVPCSTSNLGAGFDCLGLALDRYLDASFSPGGTSLLLERTGTLADIASPAENDLLLRCFRSGLPASLHPAGVIRVTSDIPIARGLGSSGAAVVAGLVLAGVALRSARDEAGAERFHPRSVLAEAVWIEGHPDNVGPALLGGLVAAAPLWRGGALGVSVRRLPLSSALGFAFAAPSVEVLTPLARAALPATVAHDVAVRSLARVLALTYGLAEADPDAIRAGFFDELHVPYRLPLIPRAEAAFAAATDAGAWAATISGSGSGLIAVCEAGREELVAAAMRAALTADGAAAIGFPVHPDHDGTLVLETAS